MHSRIYQVASKPISVEDYDIPECFYDNSDDFADYIGGAVTGDSRLHDIQLLGNALSGLFVPEGTDSFVYLGAEAMNTFKEEWAARLRRLTENLTGDNIMDGGVLYEISETTKCTHRCTYFRVHIEEWNGWAGPFKDIVEWAASQLKKGDRIYVGAVIDYHF